MNACLFSCYPLIDITLNTAGDELFYLLAYLISFWVGLWETKLIILLDHLILYEFGNCHLVSIRPYPIE